MAVALTTVTSDRASAQDVVTGTKEVWGGKPIERQRNLLHCEWSRCSLRSCNHLAPPVKSSHPPSSKVLLP